jgi:putative ATPase
MVGQPHLTASDSPFRILLERDALPHSLLYGPPGCGKTTLARIVAKKLSRPFHEFNATTLKIDSLRKVFAKYDSALLKPVIFIDEIHRLSKNQQEVLLPYMEEYRILLIGASTQNPYYSLTTALRSRSNLFELREISPSDMKSFLLFVMQKEEIMADENSIEYIVSSSSGDLRAMLNLLESASIIKNPIDTDILRSLRPQALRAGSSEADSHYELASAMIKSVRGSDIDAGLYYMAALIEGGEPPEFIARRLAILAAEDIGNANPNALNLAASTIVIVERIGYPEARIPLSQLLIYLASSPKSNSAYRAINEAQKSIRKGEILPVPPHIRTHAREYLYPHDFGGWVEQRYLEKALVFYESRGVGFEKKLDEWVQRIRGEERRD